MHECRHPFHSLGAAVAEDARLVPQTSGQLAVEVHHAQGLAPGAGTVEAGSASGGTAAARWPTDSTCGSHGLCTARPRTAERR